VLVERLVGFAVMLSLGGLAALVLVREHEAARSYLTVAGTAALAGVVALVALSLARRSDKLVAALRRLKWLAPMAEHLRRILRLRREWVPLLGMSLLFQLLAAAVVWLAFGAVGAPIEIPQAMLITAAAGVASVLPISISGLGVVEGAIAGAAVAFGVEYEPAVLAAIAVRLVVLPVSGACGLFLLTARQ
jgi:uncharacterized membrane protein YbhN (UPF0104 family)